MYHPSPPFWAMSVAAVLALACSAPDRAPSSVAVTFDTGEADAVLALLEGQRSATDWERLFRSDGYRRLKDREAAMNRAFSDEEFRAFVLSDTLGTRAAALVETLDAWTSIDVSAAAERALAYLPIGARIEATVYPSIKPRTNSFVYDLDRDPAIFMYLDPSVSAAQLENTLAHELHHIGFGTVCTSTGGVEGTRREALRWLGAFGEGIAMLAAAGGADVHPHETSPGEDRDRWDHDIERVPADMAELESFFMDILDGALSESETMERARMYYGIQGPWYTVGWYMAQVVESSLGRDALIEVLCDGPAFLRRYNDAARRDRETSGRDRPLWSSRLIERLEGGG